MFFTFIGARGGAGQGHAKELRLKAFIKKDFSGGKLFCRKAFLEEDFFRERSFFQQNFSSRKTFYKKINCKNKFL